MTTPKEFMHLMLDLGIALEEHFDWTPATEDSIGVFQMNAKEIDAIITAHIGRGMSTAHHEQFFNYIMQVAQQNGGPPTAFPLAYFFHSFYDELIGVKDGMADTNSLKAIPH